MTTAALLALWLASGLFVARLCGLNRDHDMPFTAKDIDQACEGAKSALTQAQITAKRLLAGQISQAQGRAQLERAFADLHDYTGLVLAYAGTLTTPPPYYPADLARNTGQTEADHIATGENLPPRSASLHRVFPLHPVD